MDKKRFILLLIAAACFGAAEGLLLPGLSLWWSELGLSNIQIGLMHASGALAVLLSASFIPRLLRRFGIPRCLGIGFILDMSSITGWFLVSWLLPSSMLLFGMLTMSLINGMAITVAWIAFETSLNAAIDNHQRGRCISAYMFAAALGVAIGPLLLNFWEQITTSFLWVAMALFVTGYGLGVSSEVLNYWRPEEEHPAPLIAWRRIAVIIIGLAFIDGVTAAAVYTMMPLYASNIAMNHQQVSWLISAFMVGSISAQLPLGWLLDRVPCRNFLIIAMPIVTLLMLLIADLPWNHHNALLLLMVLWGIAVGGVYIAAFVIQGHFFKGYALSRIMSFFVIANTAGEMVAPLAGGLALQFAPTSFFYLLASLYAGFLGLLLYQKIPC